MIFAVLLAAGVLHKPATCAVAWNNSAKAAQRALVAKAHPRGAFIDANSVIGTDSFSKSGGTKSTSAPGCSIAFILRTGQTMNFWGAWTGTAIRVWSGGISSSRVFPFPNNARVHADGSVGFHG